MIRISLRSPLATSYATEWVSFCVLIGLALVSVAAAFEHIRVATDRTVVGLAPHKASRVFQAAVVHQTSPIPPQPVAYEAPRPQPEIARSTPSSRAADRVPAHSDPGQIAEVAPKAPESARLPRIIGPVGDMNQGEADRSVPGATATVVGRLKDLPMLQDGEPFQTWGGEFAKGDTRLKEMIQAGALTSVQRGAKVRVLEVRGALTDIEVVDLGRRGWIRSSLLGR